MFQTFSGTSRRPRNVNLSGQSRGPFGSAQQILRPGASSGHSAVVQAQHERRARQIERERLQAAKTLQRSWRGHSTRRKIGAECRQRWDQGWMQMETAAQDPAKDLNEGIELGRARLLSWFTSNGNDGDIQRVCSFAIWLDRFLSVSQISQLAEDWKAPLVKLSRFSLCILESKLSLQSGGGDRGTYQTLLCLIDRTAGQFPDGIAKLGRVLYASLGKIVAHSNKQDDMFRKTLARIIITPLLQSEKAKMDGYEGFARELLTTPELHIHIDLDKISIVASQGHLAKVMRKLLSSTSKSSMLSTTSQERLLWALANFIYLHRHSNHYAMSKSPNIDFIASITIFLSQLDAILGKRHNIHDTTNVPTIPRFIEEEIASLINQESIMSLVASSEFAKVSGHSDGPQSEDAAILASYALNLLQSFPRRADEIRGWLYMSSTPAFAHSTEEPAIKYFWKAVARSSIYRDIYQSSNNAVALLKQDQAHAISNGHRQCIDQEWRVVFLFLELYTFVLKIMDDDEFMMGNTGAESASWTRKSALELSQVREFTIFLKNLAFAMYWNASEIIGAKEPIEPHSLASYFGNQTSDSLKNDAEVVEVPASRSFAGVEGMTLAYMKGMVTGLLRMLYERDSRRHFCGANHWLMKGLEMKGFIEAVVVEQAFRDKQSEDAEEDRLEDTMDLDLSSDDDNLIGTARTQQIRRLERLKLQQQRSSRQKLLKSLTPRLEILQNMPFFIPFATRVEIFRQFVTADQLHRRNGHVDADQWRMSVANGLSPSQLRMGLHELGKHSAKVRREHVFEDAFKQFYELGEGLKEPIQITFVDQFDTPEAGIDGGGVTKEFLTSITTEAFSTEHGGGLFVENDEHLLYPNPSAVDELREVLREADIPEGSPEFNMHIRELLQHYEFLGRVVGKCLYEGILEDIHFAPFFLVKWALTGGTGAAANESGYRANINDLRDLDKELYENLLKLKSYPGNVEDFALDFTITDAVRRDASGAPKKSISRELRRGGVSIPVTNTNRLIYISAVARHRLQTQPAPQTNAFLQGLSAMIQPAWLSMFNQSELQTLLGGDAAEIDVADLRANTMYGGVYAIGDDGLEHPTVQKFWSVLTEMGDEDRRKVLKYVTSTPRGPLLGFSQLNPRFSIRDSGSDQSRLPSTSTCVNLLKLPIFKSKEVLKERLLYAINAGAGFNLS